VKVKIIDEFPVFVFGDIHGDYETFSKIKELIKKEKGIFVFLGDYADRGDKGFEVIMDLIELQKEENIILLKGNHEDYDPSGNPTFYPCDLIEEVEVKYGSWNSFFKEIFKPFIDSLYLAVYIPGFALLVHGGICSKIRSLRDIEKYEECVLWSDPFEGYGEYPNPRGRGVLFGKDITRRVLNNLKVKYLIRSHEPVKAALGPVFEHDRKVITIQSTRAYERYGYRMKPHYLIIEKDKLLHRYLP